MAFSFKSLFTKDEEQSSRQAGAGGRLNLNPGVPATPQSAPDDGDVNLNRQAMQPEGTTPFASAYPGSPFVASPPASPSPFEMAGGQGGGVSPFEVPGGAGVFGPPFGAAPSLASPPPFQASAPVYPFEVAPAHSPASPFGVVEDVRFGGGGGQAGQSPFEVGEGNSPFGAAAAPGASPRVQDLESKGFRPLSSLPGGTVPAPTQFATGAGTWAVPSAGAPAQAPLSAAASPFEAVRAPHEPAAPQAPQPFEAAPAVSHSPPAPAPAAFHPTVPELPSAAPAPVQAPSGDGKFELSVREVLLDVAHDRLGFDPSRVPGDVMARFPFSLIMPQLSAGRVVVRISDVVDACAEKYRPAFAKSDPACAVTLPIESIFHQLPMEAGLPAPPGFSPFTAVQDPEPAPAFPAPIAPVAPPVSAPEVVPVAQDAPLAPPAADQPYGFGGPSFVPAPASFGGQASFGSGLPAFDTPFSAPAAADAGQPLPASPFSAAPSPFGLPPTPPPVATPEAEVASKPASLWDVPLVPSAAIPASAAIPPSGAPSAFAELQPLGGFPAPAPAPSGLSFPGEVDAGTGTLETPVADRQPGPLHASVSQGAAAFPLFGAPAFEDDAVESFESLGSAADDVAPPVAEVAEEAEVFEPAAGFQAARFSEDREQRSLRALFMSDECFDAGAVVRHCRALPGIDACVLLSRSGEIQSSAGEEETDFAGKASGMLGAVIQLAEGLGLTDAETFSMRSDKGMVSFFRAEPVFLGVQHSSRGFAPGVQEKLALATIELARMAGT